MTPDATTIAAILGALFFMVAGTNSVLKLVDRLKEKPIPANTYQRIGDYVTRAEMQELKREITMHLEKQDTAIAGCTREIHMARLEILAAGEHRTEKLHARIDDLVDAVGILKGKQE